MGALSSKNTKVSDMLENETKKMEEKLGLVKKMIELEADKRTPSHSSALWRTTATKKQTQGSQLKPLGGLQT